MNDLLNTTLGAVGQVGDAFDKYTGGRALRGTLDSPSQADRLGLPLRAADHRRTGARWSCQDFMRDVVVPWGRRKAKAA